ncbi:VOC family protein [Leifsonia aquatica]|uniref:VOC family protein n=1 Tax=Leifsonia aquatica TaxID=144185 RepID=UPI000469C274|nr:VOC family protein [Leifsonia aquatica]
MQKVTTFLWYDDGAEDAAALYVSLLPDSRILSVDRMGGDGGTVLLVRFVLAGVEYQAMNAGPQFPFTEAASIMVLCDDQAEVDRLWDALIADGGAPSQCGWLTDRWGLSWQITPKRLMELQRDPDPGRAHRANEAMLTMAKIDISALEAAADAG